MAIICRTPAALQLQRPMSLVAPALPDDCAEEPTNCCGSGCDPCVWERYHDYLKDYQSRLVNWELKHTSPSQHLGEDTPQNSDEMQPGSRATLRNFQNKRLLHMNGLFVDILREEDQRSNRDVRRWRVRPVGGQRVLRLPLEKLEFHSMAPKGDAMDAA